MANTHNPHDNTEDVITVLQDIFILNALEAGMTVEQVRSHLRIDKKRVSNISKYLKPKKK